MDTNCNFSTLSQYTPSVEKPWNEQRAHHLYRRLAYGASPGLIRSALLKSPTEIVDVLINEAVNLPITAAPDWVTITKNEYEAQSVLFFSDLLTGEEGINIINNEEWKLQTINDQINNSLRALLTIFWHGHFVTEIREYSCAGYAVQYYNKLQEHAIGNFKNFVREIGLTNAMLTYLNGVDNNKNRPNDNYARELYELFTLGENNGYTEEDILNTAKALTGYNNKNNENELDPDNKDVCTMITFSEDTFNTDTKTIFGRSGNFGYDDVIDILFEEKSDLIAKFIVEKLYKFFISPTLNDTVVQELANEFKADFELEPILRKLFKSEHFFDEEAMATIIKSPYDIQINMLKVTGFPVTEEQKASIFAQNGIIGQEFYQPVDVAGWQADYDWVNSATLVGRWEFLMTIVNSLLNSENSEKLRDFAKEASNNSRNVDEVVRNIIDAFIPRGLNTETDYEIAIDEFKGEVPDNYFEENGIWSLDLETVPDQVQILFQYLVTLPEFQLK